MKDPVEEQSFPGFNNGNSLAYYKQSNIAALLFGVTLKLLLALATIFLLFPPSSEPDELI